MSEIFEKLICSYCKKYLSVFPIKVYPNRQVKCGRCNSSDNDGTVSKLYETIAKELKFPCVNHYEGCKILLEPSEAILHEKTCIGTSIKCPLCNNLEGHSLKILEHFKKEHSSNYLNDSKFLISLDNKNEEKFYLYASEFENILSFISVRYDDIVKKLYLDIVPVYVEVKHDNEQVLYTKFDLYSIDNKLMYKSSEKKYLKCVWYDGLNLSNDFDGVPMKIIPHNLVVCKFFIKEDKKICFKTDFPVSAVSDSEPCNLRHYPAELIQIVEPCKLRHFQYKTVMPLFTDNTGTQKIRINFDNILGLRNRKFSDIFYLANTSWKVCIEKILKEETTFLSVYLIKEKNKIENKFSYQIRNTSITLLSENAANNLLSLFEDIIFGLRSNDCMAWGWDDFLQWSILLNPQEEYASGNEIQFELNITLEKILEHKSSCQCPGCT